MMPSGHKAFLVHNARDVDLLLMHNRTFAAEYVKAPGSRCRACRSRNVRFETDRPFSQQDLTCSVIAEAGGYSGKGEAVGCQGHKCQGEGHDGVMSQVVTALVLGGDRSIERPTARDCSLLSFIP